MFGFIGKAVSMLLLDKKARAALRKSGRAKPRGAASDKDSAIAQAQETMRGVMTPERAELIRQAMQVRQAKQTILADLSDEQRQRLVAAAMKKLLNEGKKE